MLAMLAIHHRTAIEPDHRDAAGNELVESNLLRCDASVLRERVGERDSDNPSAERTHERTELLESKEQSRYQ